MPLRMTGTLINVGTVVLGATIGTLLGERLPAGMHQRVLMGLGMVTLVVGLDNALAWRDTNALYVLGGVLLGGLVGEGLAIERRLEALGDRLQQRVARHVGGDHHARVSEAFVAGSLLFCVGPLTVVGSLQDGLTGHYDVLATKAMLDGFAAIAIAATIGWGVGLAAITVLVVQGALTLGAGLLDGVLVGESLAALTSAGGVLIIGISLKLLDLRDVKVGNYLPALVIAPALVGVVHALR